MRTDQGLYDAALAAARAAGTTLSQWAAALLARELGGEDPARAITATPVEPALTPTTPEPFPPALAGLIRTVSIAAAQPADPPPDVEAASVEGLIQVPSRLVLG